MEKLHKEPDVSRQDYYAFVNELKLFHQNRGTPFRQLPKINGREIDLQKLYNQVTALGGLQKVIDHEKWESVVEILNLPKACANFTLGLRQIYIRYLGHYEKIHFMGEEPDHDKNQSSDSHNRKQQLTLFHQVPMVYNFLQHDITDIARSTSGLNQNFMVPTDYDKLCMSLLSGLPNEQEMALNVCTILSNEGNYMLHLEQCPKLVKLLIAQAGIWPPDDNSLKMLYLQSWKGLKGRNMHRFWRSTLDLQDSQVVQLLGLELGEYDPNETLLNLESDLGALNVEGQRVLRIALILHNLSFEKNNVPVLVSNTNFIRFILLCIHSSWTNLKQTAYDTLSNIASEIKLSIEKDICSRLIFQTVMNGIQSSDRFMNIRSMDILSQLCSYEPNEDIIPSQLDVEVYQHMVSFLSVHDIMLLFFTLEALYALSDLGRYACEKIVCVHRSIGILVSLLTLDPSQYGRSGQIKMKVVETLVPVEFDEQEEKSVISETSSVTASNDLDSETFSNNWLKSTFEFSSGCIIPRNEIYAEYVSHCTKAGRKAVMNANVFAGFVKNCFPQCAMKRTESASGVATFYHEGLRRKEINTTQTGPPKQALVINSSTPCRVPVLQSMPVSCKHGQKTTHSPILKAQLSAPPRSGVTSPPLKRLAEHAANSQKNASIQSKASPIHVSSSSSQIAAIITPTSPTSGSSTLIKSLLANKVQQRNLQRQVVPQGLSKMVIYSADKTLNQVVRSPTTFVRCARPGAFSSHIRTPFQARIFSNKGRVLAPAPSKMLKNSLISTTKSPPKIIKPCLPRINGIQRDVHMEVCNQDEDTKSSGDIIYTQMNCVQNHINNDSFDSRSSMSCDGDSLQSFKDMDVNSNCNKNFILPEKTPLKFSGTNELTTSSGNILIVKPKSVVDGLLSPKEQNGSSITFVNSNDAVTGVAILSQSPQPKIVSTSHVISNSVKNNLDSQIDDLNQPLQKDKICKKAPLLNGLLDKGKILLPEEINSNTLIVLQNGNKTCATFEMDSDETKSSTSFVQSTSNSGDVSVNSVIPLLQKSVITPISLLNSSPTSCTVTSQNSVLLSSLSNSSILQSSSSNSSIVTACSFNCVSVPSPNSTFVPSSLLHSVISSSSLNSANITTLNSTLAPAINSANVSLPSNPTIVQSISTLIPTLNSPLELSSNSTREPSSNLTSEPSLNSTIDPSSSIVKIPTLISAVIPSISSTSSPTSTSTLSPSSLHSPPASSMHSPVTFLTNANSSVTAVSPVINSTILPSTTFHSDSSNLMQICTGQATFSGTIELQPDQKGVVRLHIESPENSNQGSDLSSISDITRTLETASKAISRTNAECNIKVPHCGSCETTATVTVITTNTSTLARTGQQIIVVTPALNQPQLHIQSPNIKFRILHSLPKTEESTDIVSFPHINLNQLNQFRQSTPDTPSISSATLKRPSSDNASMCTSTDVKKPRIDTKTPLLEASLHVPTSVPCSAASISVNTKPLQESQLLLAKTSPIENIGTSPKLSIAKAVPVQNAEFPNERETKTFSGLSSACDNPSLMASTHVPPRSHSSKLEFLCEWKDCGLKFSNPGSVFLHASKVHVPMCNDDMICLWENCDSMKRKRFSLLTHLQDWHCNEKVLHIQALRRKQLSQQGKTSISPPQMPPPHPGYAPDAAFLAIRRHALQYINPKELSEDKENALTKSIRLTSALILRNLVTHSSLARTYVRRFEPELAYLAMSPVESARTIAQCLSQLSRPHD